jgi:hypothetical protein
MLILPMPILPMLGPMAHRIVLLCDSDDPSPLRDAARPFWPQAASVRGVTGDGWRGLGFTLAEPPVEAFDDLAAPETQSRSTRPEGVDVIALTPRLSARGPGLIVSDVDSTVTRTEGIDLLAEAAGCVDRVAEVTARAMAGELDFAESLTERVALLEGPARGGPGRGLRRGPGDRRRPGTHRPRAPGRMPVRPGERRVHSHGRPAGRRTRGRRLHRQ